MSKGIRWQQTLNDRSARLVLGMYGLAVEIYTTRLLHINLNPNLNNPPNLGHDSHTDYRLFIYHTYS